MFLFTEPTADQISHFLEAAQSLPLSYAEAGATRATPPAGFTVDHNRITLGHGSEVFDRAVAALKTWRHFDLGWVRLVPDNSLWVPGSVVASLIHHFPLWSLNACRVLYTIDDRNGPLKRFGFAYGTLTEHAECGEERFTIEWDTASDEVCYDILAFSRPRHWLARAGYPLTRWWQRRFVRDSLAAMARHARQPNRKG